MSSVGGVGVGVGIVGGVNVFTPPVNAPITVDEYSGRRHRPLSNVQKCFKWSLFVLNVYFVIECFVMIAFGFGTLHSTTAILSGNSIPVGLIIIGFLTIFVCVIGAAAAWFESARVLRIYFTFLLICCVAMFAVGATMLSQVKRSAEYISQGWPVADSSTRAQLQRSFACCGLFHFNDSYAVQPCPPDSLPHPATPTPHSNTTTSPPSASPSGLTSVATTPASTHTPTPTPVDPTGSCFAPTQQAFEKGFAAAGGFGLGSSFIIVFLMACVWRFKRSIEKRLEVDVMMHVERGAIEAAVGVGDDENQTHFGVALGGHAYVHDIQRGRDHDDGL